MENTIYKTAIYNIIFKFRNKLNTNVQNLSQNNAEKN